MWYSGILRDLTKVLDHLDPAVPKRHLILFHLLLRHLKVVQCRGRLLGRLHVSRDLHLSPRHLLLDRESRLFGWRQITNLLHRLGRRSAGLDLRLRLENWSRRLSFVSALTPLISLVAAVGPRRMLLQLVGREERRLRRDPKHTPSVVVLSFSLKRELRHLVPQLLSILVDLLVVNMLLLLLFGNSRLDLRRSEHLAIMNMLDYLRSVLSHDLALEKLLVRGRRAKVRERLGEVSVLSEVSCVHLLSLRRRVFTAPEVLQESISHGFERLGSVVLSLVSVEDSRGRCEVGRRHLKRVARSRL